MTFGSIKYPKQDSNSGYHLRGSLRRRSLYCSVFGSRHSSAWQLMGKNLHVCEVPLLLCVVSAGGRKVDEYAGTAQRKGRHARSISVGTGEWVYCILKHTTFAAARSSIAQRRAAYPCPSIYTQIESTVSCSDSSLPRASLKER